MGIFLFAQPGIKQAYMRWSYLYHFHLSEFIPHKTVPHPSVIGLCTLRQLSGIHVDLKQVIESHVLALGIGHNSFALVFLNLFFFFPEFSQIRRINGQASAGQFIFVPVHIESILALGFPGPQISSSIVFSCHKTIPFWNSSAIWCQETDLCLHKNPVTDIQM